MEERTECALCLFALIDSEASDSGWTAYKCGNTASENYGALLNVSEDGNKMVKFTCEGCARGRSKK